MAAPGNGNSGGDRSGTRDRLVAAALASFAAAGIGNTGVGTICERAGVTKGVFSHHFPGGKESLVVEVVGRHGSGLADFLTALSTPDRSTPDLIVAAFDAYADVLAATDSTHGCPVAASVVDQSNAPAVRTAAAATFRSWIDTIVDHGDGDGVDRNLAETIIAAFEGAILLARADGDADVLRRVGRTLSAAATPH